MERLKKIIEAHGLPTPKSLPIIRIKDSELKFRKIFISILETQNRNFEWVTEYKDICEWLSDSKGRSLLMFGNCGRGKSVIGRYLIPMLFYSEFNKIVNVYDSTNINDSMSKIKKLKIVSLDDIGLECEQNNYGTKTMSFPEIVDNAEKNSNLLILSTNLGYKELGEKYGARVLDRLKAYRHIRFSGESLR